jgi:hypothetical protein
VAGNRFELEGSVWVRLIDSEAERRLSARQLRLAASACCRRAWRLLVSERSRRAVALAERRADGLVEDARLAAAHREAVDAAEQQADPAQQAAAWLAAHAADPNLLRWPEGLALALKRLAWTPAGQDTFYYDLFRPVVDDVQGPVRRAWFRPDWATPTVVALTRRVLDERDEVAMLVLADALEDAGCVDEGLLAHCRSGEKHVRGCWALDVITGKV